MFRSNPDPVLRGGRICNRAFRSDPEPVFEIRAFSDLGFKMMSDAGSKIELTLQFIDQSS